MNAYQEAKTNMYRAVELLCDNNAAIVALVVAFQTAFTNFKGKIAQIISTTQNKDVVLTGIAADKTVSKLALCRTAADVAAIIYAFATATANNTLKQEVNYSFDDLKKTRDDQLAPRCQNIHDRGFENRADLTDYGITTATLTGLQNAINAYAAETPKPRAAVSHRKTLNANLKQLFKEADEILVEQMDKLVVAFKPAHPEFVAEYEANRIIIDPPSRKKNPTGEPTEGGSNPPA